MELEQEALPALEDLNLDNPKDFVKTTQKEILARTVYAKGFPLDSTLPQLNEFFKNNFENVKEVKMRNYYCLKSQTHLFKGSVFVTFSDIDSAEDFIRKDEVIYNETMLLRYTQEKYFEMKKSEDEKKAKKTATKEATKFTFPKNTVVHFIGANGDLKREDIKTRIAKIEPAIEIAFIQYQMGENQGDIRFSNENDAEKLLAKLEDGKVRRI
jgi:RNA recognition motif-containing protein